MPSSPTLRATLLTVVLASSLAANVRAFEIPFHMNITNTAMDGVSETIGDRELRFSDRAKQQIREANSATDNTSSAAAFFPERHFTSETFAASSQRLITLREQIVALVTQDRPDGRQARRLLGGALHTLQDFYAHSNWVELGNGSFNNDLGRNVMANPAAALHACPTDGSILGPGGGGGLTSGYTGLLTINCIGLDTGKCSHGNYPDEHPLLPNCPGINKDRPLAGPNHGIAVSQATAASEDYLEQILSEIRGDEVAVAALLDAKGSLIFIVDDTGSMGEEIDGVKSIINSIVAFATAFPDLRPDNFILVRFGDPDVGSAFVTREPSSLLAAVSALFPHGGGDCPELSQTGMLNGLFASYPFSELFLFTDASSKDAGVGPTVISVAQDDNTTLNYALTGSCSPIDPAYSRGARETGGQLFFVDQFEIPLLADLFRTQLGGDFVRVLSRRGTLTSGSRTDVLPVDESMRTLVVSLSNDFGMTLTVTTPSGELLTPTSPGVRVTTLTTAVIWTITSPAIGQWTLQISGSGAYDLAVSGNSALSFERFAFGALSEEMHGGFVRAEGQPLTGESSLAEAILVGPVASASFSLLGEDESPILTPTLSRDTPKMDPGAFIGPVVLPGAPFHVLAEGTTTGGNPFRREYLRRFRPQQIQITVEGERDRNVSPGTVVQVPFMVRNHSTASLALRFRSSDSRGYGSSASPAVGTVAGGDSLEVIATVTIPASAESGAEDIVTLVATSQSDPSISNSAQVRLHVAGTNRPPDCSAASVMRLQLWPPNHQFERFDLAGLGVATDPDGDPVTFEVLGVVQDEPVGAGGFAPDAHLLGGGVFELRAERLGGGNGRVYAVAFRATDGRGGTCEDTLHVEVQHDQGVRSVTEPLVFVSTNADLTAAERPAELRWAISTRPSPSTRAGTLIQLSIGDASASGSGVLSLHDLAGRSLRSWNVSVTGSSQPSVRWDGRDANGRVLGPGMYFIRFTLGAKTLTRSHIVVN